MTDLAQRRRGSDAAWRSEVDREVARILALPNPVARMAAHVELSRVLKEEGESLPADATGRLLASLRTDTTQAVQPDHGNHEERAAQWAVERRRLALLFTLRPIASAGCFIATGVPFVTAAWRLGLGILLTPWPMLCIALAMIAAGLLSRRVDKTESIEVLAGLVVGAFAAGVAGLAASRAALSW